MFTRQVLHEDPVNEEESCRHKHILFFLFSCARLTISGKGLQETGRQTV